MLGPDRGQCSDRCITSSILSYNQGTRMTRKTFVIIGGILNILWGIVHLFPTRSILKGFGDISIDNQRILLMEWINEGLTLIFIGSLVIVVSILDHNNGKPLKAVYLLTFIMLLSMAILSLFTGFNIKFLPFKLCPIIFIVSGLCIVQGIYSK